MSKTETKKNEDNKQQVCDKCGGRLALVTGNFYYEPDEEPYLPDVQEEAIAKGGECELIAYKCDLCGHLEGFSKA